jgi:hypothetical protein
LTRALPAIRACLDSVEEVEADGTPQRKPVKLSKSDRQEILRDHIRLILSTAQKMGPR